MVKLILTAWFGLGVGLITPSALAVDNNALEQGTFREHKATYGLVYLLPHQVASTLESKVYPRLRERLLSLGLENEVHTFNLPHVTVVHIHSADPSTPERMLKELPGVPSMLSLRLKDFSVTFAAEGVDSPWWFDLGVVKHGPGYQEMMAYNTKASAALTPLRDGPLPRCTGPVFARMSDAAKALVFSYGVTGINVSQDGKEITTYNPHHTLVYSMTPLDARIATALKESASEMDAIMPDGIEVQFKGISIVEIGFMGNVLREFYRINLESGDVREVSTGKQVVW